MSDEFEACIEEYRRNKKRLRSFAESIRIFFEEDSSLSQGSAPVIHSIRFRLKDEEHLRDKLRRKAAKGVVIPPDELLTKVTDLAGLRILHIHQAQFALIHEAIEAQVKCEDWVLNEKPVAYTWDPESKKFFEGLGLRTELKESFYTSIHYLLKPTDKSPLCCELQVRTLFEEIWGEVDHLINYPHETDSVGCREQIRVLSRLVGAGSRLTDSIFRSYNEHATRVEAGAMKKPL